MPRYDYKCNCGYVIELFQGMADEHIAVCPQCKQTMDRIYTPTAFVIGDKPRWWEPKRMDAEADQRAYNQKEENGGRKVVV